MPDDHDRRGAVWPLGGVQQGVEARIGCQFLVDMVVALCQVLYGLAGAQRRAAQDAGVGRQMAFEPSGHVGGLRFALFGQWALQIVQVCGGVYGLGMAP